MHNIKIKIYNPETGKRIPIIPPLPLGLFPFALKIGLKFAKKTKDKVETSDVDISDVADRKDSSLDTLSKREIKFLVKELKSCAPFTIVDIKKNGKPVVNISIT